MLDSRHPPLFAPFDMLESCHTTVLNSLTGQVVLRTAFTQVSDVSHSCEPHQPTSKSSYIQVLHTDKLDLAVC